MRATSLLVLLCICKCIGLVSPICTVSKHEGGAGDRLQCFNASLDAILNETSISVPAIMIFNSHLRYIQERAFAKYARSLQSLNIHNCYITDIDPAAFNELISLKKLSLPSNNITRVKKEWFKDTLYLEQLDLSFNRITELEPGIFGKMSLLKRLDVRENRLTCIDASMMPGGIDKVYFVGNPLNFICRGKLTLWMRDHGVNYKTEHSENEKWLDKLLWLCAINDPNVAKSEVLMKECILMNLFNQLRTGLSTAESYPLSVPRECEYTRNLLTTCTIKEIEKHGEERTNGNVIKKLLLYLNQAKSRI